MLELNLNGKKKHPEQLDIFETVERRAKRGASIDNRFRIFHLNNPWVYKELVRLARELVRRGRETIGIKMLYEVLRWKYYKKDTYDPDKPFRLCNDFHSRYARLMMAQEKDLDGCFKLRELKS